MPFRNLKVVIIINKVLGLLSCKLVNGRLRPSSTWSCRFCVIWGLYHCLYSGNYYYRMVMSPTKKLKDYALSIFRFTAFFVSLLPYYAVAAFWSKDLVKLSDKFLTYDEKAIALGHQRKDNHVFTYLFFIYTLVTLTWKGYLSISDAVSEGLMEVIAAMSEELVQNITGTYCIFITCIFLDLTRQRFRHLNEKIVPYVSQLPITGSQGEITVYDVRYLHGVLLDCANVINALYGFGTLITFMSILLEIVSVIYLSLKELQDDGPVQMMDLSFQTIYLIAMYHFTTYEANRVEERVIKYGLHFSNEKCRIDKIEMMLYFYHRRYSFTAAEFFPLDLTIILPVVTAATTYLTLVV